METTAHKISNKQITMDGVLANSPLGADFADTDNKITKWLAEELAIIWHEFEEKLSGIPIIEKIESKSITTHDYKSLLINLRQQVIDGSAWITRAASNMSIDFFDLRAAMIEHAHEEMNDYKMLEKDYCSIGGSMEEIENRTKNIGSEALSNYIFQQASTSNPIQFCGIVFIFEGLGSKKAGPWSNLIRETLNLDDNSVSFLAYHGINDEDHYKRLKKILSQPYITKEIAEKIVKVAKVTALLYAAQLNELDNC